MIRTVLLSLCLVTLSLVSTKLNANPLSENAVFHSDLPTTNLHNNHNQQPNLPNSISGVKKNAKVGDFVMLKGRFVRKVDTNVLEFTDDGKQAVLVNFNDDKQINFIKAQTEYELWGKISRNDKLTFVDALNISIKL